jgi:hypothetical protein
VTSLPARHQTGSALLLGDAFTLRDLRLIHEAVAGEPLQLDTFRRAMEGQLEATGDTTAGGRGRRPSCFAAWRCETSPIRGLGVAGVGYPEGSAQNSRGKWVKQA